MTQQFLGLDYIYPATIRSSELIDRFDTQNLQSVAVKADAHKWGFEVALKPMASGRAEANAKFGLLANHKFGHGISQTFDIEFPQMIPAPQEQYPPLRVKVNAVSAIGTNRVSVFHSGIQNDTDITYYQGQFIQFDGDQKVYMITEGVTFNQFQTGFFRIFPRLKKATIVQQAINFAPMMRCRYSADGSSEVRVNAQGVISESVNVIEA